MARKIIILFLILVPFSCSALTAVHISDIHASSKKIRENDGGSVLSPRMYNDCLKKVKSLGADMIIATGDLTDNKGKKYYRRMKSIMRGTDVIWIMGNHDNSRDFRILSYQSNYYIDRENWRIVALNSSRKFGSSSGYLNADQIRFMKSALETEKNVIIAMHHPPFWYDGRSGIYSSEKEPRYNDFFAALTPNVKYVLTGHWHHNMSVAIDGVTYQTVTGLSQDNKCNYQIMNLDAE